ncbi:MAG: hypothetical protein HY457_00895 [Parcubacteria group bacterium]|nr:hypothetical protein [Parcubacteria group bacterium]
MGRLLYLKKGKPISYNGSRQCAVTPSQQAEATWRAAAVVRSAQQRTRTTAGTASRYAKCACLLYYSIPCRMAQGMRLTIRKAISILKKEHARITPLALMEAQRILHNCPAYATFPTSHSGRIARDRKLTQG